MIPQKVIRFLEQHANAGFAGTRDRNLLPTGHRVTGWIVDASGRLTALVPESSAKKLVADLLDNGQIALTFEEVGTHETYQLKGRYVSHRPVRPDEVTRAEDRRQRFVRGLWSMYGEEHAAEAEKLGLSVPPPSLAVEIQVLEGFLQTPGPGAGSRIFPIDG